MKKYRGQIEGGLCARKIEDYDPSSEERYFVLNGIPYGRSRAIPDIVREAAKVIRSPFLP